MLQICWSIHSSELDPQRRVKMSQWRVAESGIRGSLFTPERVLITEALDKPIFNSSVNSVNGVDKQCEPCRDFEIGHISPSVACECYKGEETMVMHHAVHYVCRAFEFSELRVFGLLAWIYWRDKQIKPQFR